MSSTIITKNSSTASAVPSAGSLVKGELAVNVTDKKIYTKDNSAAVVKVVGSLGNQEANAVAITGGTVAGVAQTGGTINNTPVGATTASTVRGTTVTATTGFVGDLTGSVTGNTTGTHTGAVTGNVTGNLTGNVTAASGTSTFNHVTISGSLDMDAGTSATITGLSNPVNNSDAATKIYVDTAISNLVDGAPANLDTLNEIAAALNDDANIAATLTAQIATKVSKAGDTMTGALAMGTNKITGLGAPTAGTDATTKTYVDTADALKLNLAGGTMSGAIAMGSNKITGLGTPTADADATTKVYVDGILGSATAAAASASAAATSETNAANSASAASGSADAAAASASSAADSYDQFDDRYLGAKASAPSVDNDGNALLTGALYWNSTSSNLFVWNGSAWEQATLTAGDFLSTGDIGVSVQAYDANNTTASNTQTLTNKTMDFNANTFNNFPTSPEIKTPTNVSPASGDIDIGETPVLVGSAYLSLYGVTMAAAQWQVSTVADFSTTVVDTEAAGTSVNFTVPAGVLTVSTTFFWRVRYKDADNVFSAFSTGTSFTTAAAFGPSIGDAFGGGFYAGNIVQGGTTYYVIIAPKSSGENSSKQYKTTNDANPVATQTLNNGPAASASMNSAAYPAAQFCEGLTIGGFSDWYLPSRDELELCYRNLKPTTTTNGVPARSLSAYTYPEGNDVSGDTMGRNRNSDPLGAVYTSGNPAQTTVTAFITGGTEAFAAASYWSSSEFSASGAWIQFFGSGDQDFINKGNGYYARAVRRLAI